MDFKKINRILAVFIVNSIALAETLDEAIVSTLSDNPEYLLSQSRRKESDSRLSQAFGGYLPKINFNMTYGRDQQTNDSTRAINGGSRTLTKREVSYSATQMLFDGFSVKSQIEESISRVKNAAENVVASAQDVGLRVVEVYLEVLRRRELVELAKENLATHQEIHQQIKLRSESGIGKKADLEQATSRLALARTNLMVEQSNLRDAESNYERVVGHKPTSLVRPKQQEEMLPANEESGKTLALSNHPVLHAANHEIDALSAQKRAARAAYFPTLEFEVSGANDSNVNGVKTKTNSISAFLRLRFNIFNGGSDRARERETAWLLESAKEQRNQVRRQVQNSLSLSWNTYKSTKAQLKFFQQHVKAVEKTKEAYQEQFKLGQRTLLDLLNTDNELFSAKSTYLSAQYNELLARYRVLNSTGEFNRVLKIKLPESADTNTESWLDGFQS